MVSLSAPSNKTVTVNYSTANGTATAGSDYNAASGKLTFAPGETSKTILVPVRGDRLAEANENFFVKLSGAKDAKIADGQGVVTIVDDEPRISISDAVSRHGRELRHDALHLHREPVGRLRPGGDGQLRHRRRHRHRPADSDYLATSGTLTFAPGETTKTITVEVIGDATPSRARRSTSTLATRASMHDRNVGLGGILDDDGWPGEPCDPTTGGCSTEGDGVTGRPLMAIANKPMLRPAAGGAYRQASSSPARHLSAGSVSRRGR